MYQFHRHPKYEQIRCKQTLGKYWHDANRLDETLHSYADVNSIYKKNEIGS